MKNKGLIATIIIMLGVIVVLLVTLLFVKMPTVISFDGLKIIKETEVDLESEELTKSDDSSSYVEIVEAPKLDTNIHTYEGYNGNVTIEYPEITGMEDEALQQRINDKIRTNALSIVPLYPISTALQNLDVFCEVNYLDENYITVLYSGLVIGKDATSENANSKTGASYKSSHTSNISDPYLNGFVDPLAGVQSTVNQSAFTNYSEFSALPLPKVGGTSVGQSGSTASSSAKSGTSKQLNGSKSSVNDHTADIGPTVYEEPAPSANRDRGFISQGSDAYTGPGVSNTPEQGAPVVNGFASSSASTINQKIFYTNTIDLKTGADVKLSDVADPKVLAKYARSSNAEFVNVDAEKTSEVRAYIRKTVETKLVSQLANETDFRNDDLKAWPKHFSFVGSDGNVYFTVKLSSKLGNYVIIKYQK